jgi:hypothetical protein
VPKHSAKALLSVTLGKQHTSSTVSANSYLPSVFYRTLDKWRQKSGLPSVFQKYTRQSIIVCRVFLGITLGKPIFQRKKYFFSQHTIIVCRVFWELHLANLFSKEK